MSDYRTALSYRWLTILHISLISSCLAVEFDRTLDCHLSESANEVGHRSPLRTSSRGEAGEEWDVKFNELVRFKQIHGHCCVPASNESRILFKWIRGQKARSRKLTRRTYSYTRAADLSEHEDLQLQRLVELGLLLDAKEARWEHFFGQYLNYVRTYSDNCPRFRFPENPPLGVWVSRQRMLYHRGMLLPRRWKKLQAVGFVWTVAYPRERMLVSAFTHSPPVRKGPTTRAIVAPQLCASSPFDPRSIEQRENEQEMASLGNQIDYLSQSNVAGLGQCERFYAIDESARAQTTHQTEDEELQEEMRALAEQKGRLTILQLKTSTVDAEALLSSNSDRLRPLDEEDDMQ